MQIAIKLLMLLMLASGFYLQSIHTMLATLLWIASALTIIAMFSDTTVSEIAGKYKASSKLKKAAGALYGMTLTVGMAVAGYPILAGVMFLHQLLSYAMIRTHLAMEG